MLRLTQQVNSYWFRNLLSSQGAKKITIRELDCIGALSFYNSQFLNCIGALGFLKI